MELIKIPDRTGSKRRNTCYTILEELHTRASSIVALAAHSQIRKVFKCEIGEEMIIDIKGKNSERLVVELAHTAVAMALLKFTKGELRNGTAQFQSEFTATARGTLIPAC